MNTPSHFLMTAALGRAMVVKFPRTAFWCGSIAPDVPLWGLSIGGYLWFTQGMGWGKSEALRYMFGTLYFQSPWWLASHNLLHAPLVVLGITTLLWMGRERWGGLGRAAFWFFAACLLHSVVDVLTHHDDGPLLFFPFDWSTRFHSPISYWDPDHYGREFSRFELVFDLLLMGYLWRTRKAGVADSTGEQCNRPSERT